MAEYESIKGTRVKYLSSDPTLTNSSTEGQVWYNSTTGTNKVLSQIKATSSGGNLNTARFGAGSSGSGSQSSGLYFGGATAATTYSTATEEYNGFSWVNGGSLGLARYYLAGFGTQTAAVAAGGYNGGNKSEVEEYDGSSWSEVTDIPTAGRSQGAAGTLTAGLIFGAADSPQVKTFEYDGTNWTAGGDLNTGRKYMAGTGTQTAALAAGGSFGAPIQSNDTEEYDGSAWTSVNDINTARRALTGFGTQTSAAIGGGTPPLSTAIEEYDGTNWATSPATLSTARRYLGGFGSLSSAGAFCGGKNGTVLNSTEEYNSNIEAVTTTAAWGSGENYPGPAYGTGSGTNASLNAGVAFGGYVSGSKSSATNEYDGSSWTGANAMSDVFVGGAYGGTQTAAFGAGGYAAPPSRTTATEQYDGTNWTGGGALSVAASQNVGFGTSTAGVVYGGEGSPDPAIKTSTQEYDGSSWTTVNTMPVGASGNGTGFGTQTAGIRSGGTAPTPNPSTWDGGPATFVNITLEYDGTNWTAGAFSNFGGRNSTGFGVQTSGVTAGGEGSPGVPGLSRTEQYDGTSWSDVATMPRTSTSYMAGFGASSGSGAVVGGVHTVTNSVDEFTGQVVANQASTLTTS